MMTVHYDIQQVKIIGQTINRHKKKHYYFLGGKKKKNTNKPFPHNLNTFGLI